MGGVSLQSVVSIFITSCGAHRNAQSALAHAMGSPTPPAGAASSGTTKHTGKRGWRDEPLEYARSSEKQSFPSFLPQGSHGDDDTTTTDSDGDGDGVDYEDSHDDDDSGTPTNTSCSRWNKIVSILFTSTVGFTSIP